MRTRTVRKMRIEDYGNLDWGIHTNAALATFRILGVPSVTYQVL